MLFKNRTEAGCLLALKLNQYTNCQNGLILALPRGGLPIASEISKSLQLPLDICLVRKLGVPRHKELAMGAIASNGVKVLNQDIIDSLNISQEDIERVIQQERKELARRDRIYRGNRPLPIITNKIIILVDDGIATGATLRAAIIVLKQQKPTKIIIAVPVVSLDIAEELELEVDELVCLKKPKKLNSISLWYQDFHQVNDEEVRHFLEK
jgi:predicted phosphoribosyltransferase